MRAGDDNQVPTYLLYDTAKDLRLEDLGSGLDDAANVEVRVDIDRSLLIW